MKEMEIPKIYNSQLTSDPNGAGADCSLFFSNGSTLFRSQGEYEVARISPRGPWWRRNGDQLQSVTSLCHHYWATFPLAKWRGREGNLSNVNWSYPIRNPKSTTEEEEGGSFPQDLWSDPASIRDSRAEKSDIRQRGRASYNADQEEGTQSEAAG